MEELVPYLPTLEESCPVAAAVEAMSRADASARGAIYTRREVVSFMLDLAGHTTDRPLASYRLLEPSFEGGDFVLAIVKRLIASERHASGGIDFSRLTGAIRGVEFHRDTFDRMAGEVRALLQRAGAAPLQADELASGWLAQGDFLLTPFEDGFTHVVGNPPYLRQEAVPDALLGAYRRRFSTLYDRADLYVPFIEHALAQLGPTGKLSFICADRWMKNRYGAKLRKLVSERFHLSSYVDMVGTDAFHAELSAYPAITVIERAATRKAPTRIFTRPDIEDGALGALARGLTAEAVPAASGIREIERVAAGSDPWILDSFEALSLVRRLEDRFPTLEEAGCKVGIGVATGADKVFIGPMDALDVEPSRRLPIILTKDIRGGRIDWGGQGVINPFDEDGGLVRLSDYPKLAAYLEARRDIIARRHVAKKSPRRWYRTIDRIHPALARREKLLIPDIKGDAVITHEPGKLYPHHNLYYMTADDWSLRALQAVLGSGIARLFVALYSTKMRGGFLRFQAQYLRRIRLLRWESVAEADRETLERSGDGQPQGDVSEVVARLYGLSDTELRLVREVGARAA